MVLLKQYLAKACGNNLIQSVLKKNVQVSQYLMGIGSGSNVLTSGEQAIFHVLKQKQPPYCIFDIGANKGQYAQLILDYFSVDDVSIHCFEPSVEAFKNLAESFIQHKGVRLNNIGIGKDKGNAVLYSDSGGSGLASLTQRRLNHIGVHFNYKRNVEITTVDIYCTENEINNIDLLKLDIEGHELDALFGAKRMFEKKSINIVAFEFGGCNIDTRTFFQDFYYFFCEFKMKIFRVTPSGYLFPIKAYNEMYEQFRTTVFIAM